MIKRLLLLFVLTLAAQAQCLLTFAIPPNTRKVIDNRTMQCFTWKLVYYSSGTLSLAVSIEKATSPSGPWTPLQTGTSPSTALSGSISVAGAPAYVSVYRSAAGAGMLTGVLSGINPALGGGGGVPGPPGPPGPPDDSKVDESVLTQLGDLPYLGAGGLWSRLPGNILATKKFLCQLGNGTISAPPDWCFVSTADIPGLVVPPHTSSFTGTTLTVTAAVHLQGIHPIIFVYDSTGEHVAVSSYCKTAGGATVSCADPTSSGDIVIPSITSGTYTYAVYGLNSPGPKGDQGIQGIQGIPGANGVITDFVPTKTSSTVVTVAPGSYRYGSNFQNIPVPITFTLQTVTVASITTGATTIITTSAPMTNLVNGQALNVSLTGTGAGCAAATGIFVITRLSTSQFSIAANSSAGCTLTSGIVGATNGGVMLIFANSAGQIQLDHPASLGALVSASSYGITNQSSTMFYPKGSLPIAYVTISAGAVDTLASYLTFLSVMEVQGGEGIDALMVGGQVQVSVASNVAQVDKPSAWVNAVIMKDATKTLPWRTGTGSPNARDNCVDPGEVFFQKDGPFLWVCTIAGTPGTWVRANTL